MLRLPGEPFTQGRSKFADHAPGFRELTTVGTFFVSQDWPSGLTFLGYSGLLDSIRFALDPQANHFYFGLPW